MTRPTQDQINAALWRACDTLRGPVDSTEYKDYILVFLFLKYLSDVWNDKREELRAQYGDDETLLQRKLSRERFVLPEGTTFEHIVANSNHPDLGDLINRILASIEDANRAKLEGVFRGIDFNNEARLGSTKERNRLLQHLINDFNQPSLDYSKKVWGDKREDIVGNAYMYLTERFAASAGKKGGEFYTPHSVSELLARLVAPREGDRIYDGMAGSAGLLIEAAQAARDDQGRPTRNFALYGQEINGSTFALAKMNMFLHGFDSARIERGNTLTNPLLLEGGRLMKFDVVVGNPPFSLDKWGFDVAENDLHNRFSRGLPPKSKGDYAFILHMIESATEGRGRVGVIVAHGVLFRGSSEGAIRKRLIQENLLDAVIGLPGNLFFGTGIPAAILLFRKDRGDKKDVLFIDASRDFEAGKKQNRLLDEHLERVVATYQAYESVPRYAYRATLAEIQENDYNLNIARYVDTFEAEEAVDVQQVQREIRQLETDLADVRQELDGYLKELGIEL
ncbi:type I restriction-modification system subunit M [Hymenobacter pini]|uniref:type I restriction-modification system subunit M n=1 Tax=Hymenobacter pini TaxID=2880879 RepID=UPI001CF14A6A|nr:type I restriction-modification system subunit M [Hymenobacter pini]MCA8831908.1 type I restriction-modification system subunit M [Hymenobacter pini]